MSGFIIDLRSAFRQFARNRGLTVVALTSLAVGIGVSVAITSVANAVLVRPLPYDTPEHLVMIWARGDGPLLPGFWDPRATVRLTLTSGRILQWKEQSLPFVDLAVLESWETSVSPRVDLIDGGSVERLRGTFATANLFSVLGVRAALGRTYGEKETGAVVISDGLWRRRFGADPSVLGKTITLATGRERDREVFEIIGVLPTRFRFDYPEETEIWLPLTSAAIESIPTFVVSFRAVARLRPGVSVKAAETAMQALPDRPGRTPTSERLWLEPVHDYVVGASRPALFLISVLTLLVLLSGAINAATVFAAATVSRLREMRVRRALGASQRRLVRQVFTEAAMIALLAGAVGVATVSLALPALRALLPAGLSRVDEIGLDWLTLFSVCGAVVLSTLLAGLVPAWLSVRGGEHPHLEDTHTATTSRAGLRLRIGLLGTQFALVTALLIASGMLVRSFWNIMHVDKGFEANSNVYVAEFRVIHRAYLNKSFSQPAERELLRRVLELSYVDGASVTSVLPLRGTDGVPRLRTTDGQTVYANRRTVDRGYFDVMRIPLVSGRWFTEGDTSESEPVAVVSQSLANAVYPGTNPLGKDLWGSGARIVGVVSDVRDLSLIQHAAPAFYVPRTQAASNRVCLLVRTETGQHQLAADLRRIVGDLYPEQPLQPLTSLAQVVDDAVSDRRAYAVICSAFAVAMLLLSGLGLCGHLSHVVAERARDLAIRSALGASSRQQLHLLVRHVVPALVGGLGIAMGAVYLLSPLVAPFLFEINRFDVISCAVSALLITGFTAAAVLLPARRVSMLDAATMLRST